MKQRAGSLKKNKIDKLLARLKKRDTHKWPISGMKLGLSLQSARWRHQHDNKGILRTTLLSETWQFGWNGPMPQKTQTYK